MQDAPVGAHVWFVRAKYIDDGSLGERIHIIAGEMEDWDSGLTECGDSLTWFETVAIQGEGPVVESQELCYDCVRGLGANWCNSPT